MWYQMNFKMAAAEMLMTDKYFHHIPLQSMQVL